MIRSGQNHLARHSERGEEYKADRKRSGKTSKNGRVWSSPSLRGSSGEQRKMDETGCKVICGALTTPAIKGQVKLKVKNIEKNPDDR